MCQFFRDVGCVFASLCMPQLRQKGLQIPLAAKAQYAPSPSLQPGPLRFIFTYIRLPLQHSQATHGCPLSRPMLPSEPLLAFISALAAHESTHVRQDPAGASGGACTFSFPLASQERGSLNLCQDAFVKTLGQPCARASPLCQACPTYLRLV